MAPLIIFDNNIHLIIFVTVGKGFAGAHHRGQGYQANLPSLWLLYPAVTRMMH